MMSDEGSDTRYADDTDEGSDYPLRGRYNCTCRGHSRGLRPDSQGGNADNRQSGPKQRDVGVLAIRVGHLVLDITMPYADYLLGTIGSPRGRREGEVVYSFQDGAQRSAFHAK